MFELGWKSGWEFPKGEEPRCGPALQEGDGTEWFSSLATVLTDNLLLSGNV